MKKLEKLAYLKDVDFDLFLQTRQKVITELSWKRNMN